MPPVAPADFELNANTDEFVDLLLAQQRQLNLQATTCPDTGARLIDLGNQCAGGLEAGRCLAEICLATLGDVRIVPARAELSSGPAVQVQTDWPLVACLASQYAGWKLAQDKYFAMGSGPFRLAAIKEPLFAKFGWEREQATSVVGILEARGFPPPELIAKIAEDCQVTTPGVTLLAAPTASLAGGVQIVARSVETALHKLLELGFDVSKVISGYGVSPLPPPGKDDLAAIGRTNDAILYGGEVTLYVRCEDDLLAEYGPQTPSQASDDYGQPFQAIFERYQGDFYQIDPHLFSPAVVTFHNLATGRTFQYGKLNPAVLQESFFGGPL
ncbi:MAG: methenyltetrahydromethanopterin cyclohydrolase [Pirellulales bacterium]|nr:methenyltetrahydromethanopterin cyclohydrolase [Pirellulales bacterium]